MDEPQDRGIRESLEAEVWNAIAAFEQILEAMPNDQASLDALAHAYEQIGDLSRATEYTLRLASVLVEKGEWSGARTLLEKARQHAEGDPRVKELESRLARSSEPGAAQPTAAAGEATGPQAGTAQPPRGTVSVADELAFAWSLMESGQVSQEDYVKVVHDLTELSLGDRVVTASVLHALEARDPKNIEKILEFVAREFNTPFISLSCFDVQPAAFNLLPHDFMVRRGVMVFELLGRNALVALMNPADRQLRRDVEALASRPCHFYITRPSEFDLTVSRTAERLSGKAPGAEGGKTG